MRNTECLEVIPFKKKDCEQLLQAGDEAEIKTDVLIGVWVLFYA